LEWIWIAAIIDPFRSTQFRAEVLKSLMSCEFYSCAHVELLDECPL